MERTPNKLREKLGKGQLVTGSCLYSWSPNVMDAAGLAGLDFMRIENEHAWRQDGSAEHLMRAALLAGVVPIMRIDRENPFLVRKALEIGAGGIIVPDVNTPEHAKEVVSASKFPPKGMRGYSGNCFSGGWGKKAGGPWVEWSNSEPMIGIMIENIKAMDCVDEIMAVEGVDFALFGPADYSMSLGFGKPSKNDEKVQEAMRKTVAAARKVGKHTMMNPGTNPDEIKKYVEMGFDMIEISNDVGIAMAGWAKAATQVAELKPSK